MNTMIRLEKIIKTIDYSDTCSVCHKAIKNAYYTNMGIMGLDCFCAAIGLPRVRNTTTKSPVLPAEQYESLAEGIIRKLESITDAEWLVYWKEYYTDLKSLTKSGFNFVVQSGYDHKDAFNILLMHQHDIAKLTGTPMDMMDKIMDSKFYTAYYFATGRFGTNETKLL